MYRELIVIADRSRTLHHMSQTLLVLLIAATLASCTRQIALYDQHVYQKLVELKVESSNLISKAEEPYDDHRQAAENLMLEVRKLTEYVRGIPKNDVTHQMLQKIADPEEKLLGGALQLWKKQGTLSSAVIGPIEQRIAEAYDQVLELERQKIRNQ